MYYCFAIFKIINNILSMGYIYNDVLDKNLQEAGFNTRHIRLQLDEFQVKPGSPLCTSLLLAIFFTMSISSWKAKTNNKILKVTTIHQKNRNTSCLIQPVGKKGGDFI